MFSYNIHCFTNIILYEFLNIPKITYFFMLRDSLTFSSCFTNIHFWSHLSKYPSIALTNSSFHIRMSSMSWTFLLITQLVSFHELDAIFWETINDYGQPLWQSVVDYKLHIFFKLTGYIFNEQLYYYSVCALVLSYAKPSDVRRKTGRPKIRFKHIDIVNINHITWLNRAWHCLQW